MPKGITFASGNRQRASAASLSRRLWLITFTVAFDRSGAPVSIRSGEASRLIQGRWSKTRSHGSQLSA